MEKLEQLSSSKPYGGPTTSLAIWNRPDRSSVTLVSNCSGFLLSTPFADVLHWMAGPYKDDGSVADSMSPATSTDLAKVLNALFQISKGALQAIEVHGGRDIAFIAAVAYWLLDLRGWVQTPKRPALTSTEY